MNISAVLKLFLPKSSSVTIKEKFISAVAAIFAIIFVMLSSQHFLSQSAVPWVVASMGASAVLLFAIPQGPLSQPWPFIGGHMISAFIGITVLVFVQDLVWASALSVSLAIFFMYLTGSLHPPGGATALTVVVADHSVQSLGYQFLLTPLALNLSIMLVWALIVNNLISNRSYPTGIKKVFQSKNEPIEINKPLNSLNISRSDLHQALKEINVFVDVSEQELDKIFHLSINQLRKRRMGEILCEDIMSSPVISVEYGSDIEGAWNLMAKHKIRGLPVVDNLNRVIGMITIADFLNQVKSPNTIDLKQRFKTFLKRTPDNYSDKPEYVGHVMAKPAVVINHKQHIHDIFDLFYNRGPHHLPVVDDKNRLLGMITPKDLLAALHSDGTIVK